MVGSGVAAQMLIGDRYVLESLIGRGGMGEVWRAQHVALNSYVAIKFLAHAEASDAATRKRFLTEARVTASLKTRHAVGVFDFGFTEDGQPYIVMELLEGETLSKRLHRDGTLSPALTVRFLAQVARALDKAHQMGIVHRDLKPDNIIVVSGEDTMAREAIKVLDFGIAKLVGDLEEAKSDRSVPPPGKAGLVTFTRTGGIVGTPSYMAPEQIRGDSTVTPAADIWALGVVAFECLMGALPFSGKDVPELFRNVLANEHLKASTLSPSLAGFDAWFEKACAQDAAHRFATAPEATSTLAQVLGLRTRDYIGPGEPGWVPDTHARGPLATAPTIDVHDLDASSEGARADTIEIAALGGERARLDHDTRRDPARQRPRGWRWAPIAFLAGVAGLLIFAAVSRRRDAASEAVPPTSPATVQPSSVGALPSDPPVALPTPAPPVTGEPSATAEAPSSSARITKTTRRPPPPAAPTTHAAAVEPEPAATTAPPQPQPQPAPPPPGASPPPSAFVLPPTGL